MKIKELFLEEAYEITLEHKTDNRGFFMRTFDDKILEFDCKWVQENQSFSKDKNIVRGMHFQFPPHAEAKLVRASTGEILVVIVDLRKNSSTFGKWEKTIISYINNKMLFIPKGFAMGICTLTENCTLLYKMDNYYSPNNQGQIKWNDPDLNIEWPITEPTLSERDKNAMSFKEFVKEHRGL